MNCKKAHKEIIFYLEGDLLPTKEKEIEAHLKQCPDCMAFAEDLKLSLGIISNSPKMEVTPFFYTRLKARIENLGQIKVSPMWERFFVVFRPVFFSILLAVGIFSGIKIGQKTTDYNTSYSSSQVEPVPYLNELGMESLESFLME